MLLAGTALATTAGAQETPAPQPATPVAETEPAGGLADIVVTARRRAENLQDTPISITAISGDELESRGLTQVTSLTNFTPNVTFEGTAPLSGSNAAAFVFIRGVGQTDFNQQTEPGVGIYLDGVYLGRAVGQVMSTVDLERIEVLRGPQGTLFGRNTIGGAISITTKKPNDTFEGYLDVTTGRYNRIDVRGAVNVPITDTLFVRANAASINRDGYIIREPDGLDLGDQNKLVGRIALRWQPTSDVTVDLAVDGERDRENGAPVSLIAVNTRPVTGQPAGSPPNFAAIANCSAQGLPPVSPPCTDFNGTVGDRRFYNEQWLPSNEYQTFASGPFANGKDFASDLDMYGVNLTAAWDFGSAEIKSISAYRNVDAAFARDDDHSPILITSTSNDYKQDQFSQEFQLNGRAFNNKLNYTLGVYYFEENGTDVDLVITPVSLFQSSGPIRNDSKAAFAQATYALTERLSFTGGIRYTDETKRYTPNQFYITNPAGFPGLNEAGEFGVGPEFNLIQPRETRKLSFQEWTPLANVAFKVTDDVLTYFTFTQGYKSGGFTQRIFPAQRLVPDFNPEFVDVFEVGVKSDFFDRRLRINLSAFNTDYSDIQVVVQEGFAPQTRNAASARIRGFELETSAAPIDELILSFTAGYLDAKYEEIGAAVAGITTDSKFNYSPEWSLSASAAYTIRTSAGAVTPRVDWTYRDGFFTDALNTPEIFQPGYHLVNASVVWEVGETGFRVSGGVTNLTDKRYFPVASQDLAVKGSAEASWARPREWYLSARYSF